MVKKPPILAMSYKFDTANDLLHVKYYGTLFAHDISRMTSEDKYISGLRRYKKVIYDYTLVQKVHFTPEDAKAFAVLAKVESVFTDNIRAVMVLPTDTGHGRANIFVELLRGTSWQVDIVKTADEACEILNASSD